MPDPTPNPAANQRRIRLAILAVGGALALAFAYGGGMRGQKKALETVKQERRVLRERLRLTELKVQGCEVQLQQWEARRQVSLALRALDQRNFGIVRDRLDAAAGLLDAASGVGAANAASLTEVGAALRGVKVDVGPDLETLRGQLLAIADRMDAELAKVAPQGKVSPVTVPAPNLNDIPRQPGPEIGR